MESLPLPPLEQTLDKFLVTIRSLYDENQCHIIESNIDELKKHDLPLLQTELEKYADKQIQQQKSWVSDFWLDAYLCGRGNKALSSNVGFQINFSSNEQGMARVAQWVWRAATTHRDYLANRIPPRQDNRGNELSMDGWKVLAGAMREPQEGLDTLYFASDSIKNRHMSVFWKGSHYVVPVTDAQGNVYSKAVFERLLLVLSKNEVSDYPFTLMSALPSEALAEVLVKACENDHNQRAYDALKDSWFCLSLFESDLQETAKLHEQTFIPAHAWQYKPFTYQMDLNSDFMMVHVEHTGLDGGTLSQILNYAFALEENEHPASQTPEVASFNWQLSGLLIEQIEQELKPINQAANALKLAVFEVDYSRITQKVSHDAIFQLAFVYAQLKVFDKLRNTYEAVDTSQFLAGRTECLRPNTQPARELAKKLLSNQASIDDLNAALAAQKSWVIDCKTGQAIDRHLFALTQIAPKQRSPALNEFITHVNQYLGSDFLSTSTVGGQSPIRRFIFSPTSSGGFGINYSMSATHYEFCITADEQSAHHLEPMQQAITQGVNQLIDLIESHHE